MTVKGRSVAPRIPRSARALSAPWIRHLLLALTRASIRLRPAWCSAPVAEPVDARDSKSRSERSGGSSPSRGTKICSAGFSAERGFPQLLPVQGSRRRIYVVSLRMAARSSQAIQLAPVPGVGSGAPRSARQGQQVCRARHRHPCQVPRAIALRCERGLHGDLPQC